MISKSILALGGLALAVLAPAAQAAIAEDVDGGEAMECSALFTVLASGADNTADYDQLVGVASRWLVIASQREGRSDVISETELSEWVAELLFALDAQDDEVAKEAFLFDGIDVCEERYQRIAEEFDSIEID